MSYHVTICMLEVESDEHSTCHFTYWHFTLHVSYLSQRLHIECTCLREHLTDLLTSRLQQRGMNCTVTCNNKKLIDKIIPAMHVPKQIFMHFNYNKTLS